MINDLCQKVQNLEKKGGTIASNLTEYDAMCMKGLSIIKKIFGENSDYYKRLSEIANDPGTAFAVGDASYSSDTDPNVFSDRLKQISAVFNAAREELIFDQEEEIVYAQSTPLENVLNVCNRFFQISNDLRNRERGREPLLMEDEYDVQYLFGAILKIYFDDVRAEEWTPSYAGGSSRIDFILRTEKIAIEIKFASERLNSRRLGEELIVDIEKYQAHPDSRTLICFVYDPNSLISNPVGIENDLSRDRSDSNLDVYVLIRPKRI